MRVLEDNNTPSLSKDVMEEGNDAADSTSAGWDGTQLGRVPFPPKTLSEEAHLGCADGGVKLHWVADDKEFDESGVGGQDEQEMTAAGPDTLPCEPHGLEKHEIGPAPKYNPGPLFAVGGVIMCDVPGSIKGMQWGFVLMADHSSKYCI